MNLAQHRYGRLPWREVVTPAEAMARSGFVLGSAADYYLQHTRDSVFAWDRQTSASLRRGDGNWVQESDRMVIDGLADTLALVAENGARTMYDGELAHDIAADMDRRGGLLTRDDLSAYRPVVREALACGSGGWALRTNPPPAFGGAVLTAMLSLLGDRPRGDWTVEDVTHLVAVFRRVLGYRRDRLDVAADRDMAVRALLDEVGIAQPGSASTAHISVVDSAGATCAITASSGYGSGATVPGTGLWLNNCLGEHELNRGPTPLPGERLPSNMAPTVGRSDDGGVLAIGSPGADRITTALTQVLASLTSGRSGLQQAIDRPRLHLHYLDEAPDAVRIEAEEDMPLPETDLTVRRHHRLSMYFGGVAAAHRSASGEVIAAADPRRAGAVAVSPG